MARYLAVEYTKSIVLHVGFFLLWLFVDRKTGFKNQLLNSFKNSELAFAAAFLTFVAASIFFLELALSVRAPIFAFLLYMVCHQMHRQ